MILCCMVSFHLFKMSNKGKCQTKKFWMDLAHEASFPFVKNIRISFCKSKDSDKWKGLTRVLREKALKPGIDSFFEKKTKK